MEYEVGILDRIVLVQILSEAPKMGSYLYYQELNKVAMQVGITQEEQDDIGWTVNDENGSVAWNGELAGTRKVEIPECVEKIIVEGLKKLDGQEQLRPEHIPVYEKFVLPYDERKAAEADAEV